MFNGIIYKKGLVTKIKKFDKSIRMTVKSQMKLNNKDIGSSICCNGACLTLLKVKKNLLDFFISHETIKKTNLKKIKVSNLINLEKSIKFGNKISGHYVQGHVDLCSDVKKISKIGKSWVLKINIPTKFKKFIVEKGSIAINGVSLTISKVNKFDFEITIIPHTLSLTNLINLERNSLVNIEFDIFSKYLINLNN